MVRILTFLLLLSVGYMVSYASSTKVSPYSELTQRSIKALSAAQVDQLLAGQGMGMALTAELNGYPGPKHVLELASQLQLDDTQARLTEQLYQRMLNEARLLGKQLVEQEQVLESLFTDQQVQADQVTRQLESIGVLRGRLRAVHLNAHIEQTAILTPEQASAYQHLRGYHQPGPAGNSHHHQRHH